MCTEPFLAPSRHARRRRFAFVAAITAVVLSLGVVSAALAMKANFDSPLNLMNGGQKVDAHGPMGWDAGDVSATVTFTITQGSVSGSRTATYSPSDTSWHLTITAAGGGHFHSGTATATGSSVVTVSGGGTETYTWTQSVNLN
jgi:hypothetical protein